jgi:hypothetical protein
MPQPVLRRSPTGRAAILGIERSAADSATPAPGRTPEAGTRGWRAARGSSMAAAPPHDGAAGQVDLQGTAAPQRASYSFRRAGRI